MKTLRMIKIASFLPIIMMIMSFIATDAWCGHAASPFRGGNEGPGVMPPASGNSTVQQAQTAASTAVQVTPPSNIDTTPVAPAVTTTPAATPGVGTQALAVPLSTMSKSLKVNIQNPPLGNTFNNKNSTGINSADDKSQLKVMSLKETILIKPDSVAPATLTINDKEKPDPQEIMFKPIANKDNLSKEDIKMMDSLKVIIKDLKELETFTDTSKIKEVKNKLVHIANMINSDKENMRLVHKNNEMGKMFKELKDKKKLLMLKYEKAIEPYYASIRKILAKNIAVLQVAGIMKQVTEEDIKKMSRDEIDKIIEKLHKAKDKSFAKEYVLQQEAKYKKEYIDPSGKKMASDMIGILNDFTKKASEIIK